MFQINLLSLKQLNKLLLELFFNLSFKVTSKVWNIAKISSQNRKVSQFQQFLYIHLQEMKLEKILEAQLRACVSIVIGLQDYTAQLEARSFQRLHHA